MKNKLRSWQIDKFGCTFVPLKNRPNGSKDFLKRVSKRKQYFLSFSIPRGMTIHFGYEKRQVIQALRYHFISRPEIKTMLIVVNIFALVSIILYSLQKITPVAFLVSSGLWIVLMISFWFIMPGIVYKRAETFQHDFTMHFEANDFTLAHEKGSRTWPWKSLNNFIESPHFFHLYFDSRSFFLVPKSGCRDKDEIFELRQLLKEKVKKK